MMHPDSTRSADAAFAALLHQADREVDSAMAATLDVEGMLTHLKQRAAASHESAVRTVRQELRELLVVGASLTQAFSAPVQPTAQPRPVVAQAGGDDGGIAAAAMLRRSDGLHPVHTQEYAESSWDLALIVPDAVDGNRAAVEQLLGYIRPLIVRYCRARIGRLERTFASADDVAQDVCLAVLTALSTYRDQGRPFLAFVYGIAAHKVAEAHRSDARNQAELVTAVENGPLVDPPHREVVRAETSARLSDLLRVLPVRQREILVLRVVVGLTAEETADAIGSTPGAVRVGQHRALVLLRRAAARAELL